MAVVLHEPVTDDPGQDIVERQEQALQQPPGPEALVAWVQLLADAQRTLGADHPNTVAFRAKVAESRRAMGDFVGSISEMDDVVRQRIQVLGAGDPETLVARLVALLWRGEGFGPPPVLAAVADLVDDMRRTIGYDHPYTLKARHTYAAWLPHTDIPFDTLVEWELVAADEERVLGADDPDTTLALRQRAFWRQRFHEDVLEAESIDFTLLTDLNRERGDSESDAEELAREEAGEQREASEWWLDQVIAARRKIVTLQAELGEAHPDVLYERLNIATTDPDRRDRERVRAEAVRLAADAAAALEPDHWIVKESAKHAGEWG